MIDSLIICFGASQGNNQEDKRKMILNKNVTNLSPSPTLAINEKSSELQKQGKKIYRFGFGGSPFPIPEAVVEALKTHASRRDYLPVAGLLALREGVANFHRREDGLDIHPDQVVVGPGSKELIFLLQLVFEGDVLIPTPSWVSYAPQARILGKRVHMLETSYEAQWKISLDQLEEFFSTLPRNSQKLLMLNYPSNPHGGSYTPEEFQKMVELLRKNNTLVLSDEIYGQLRHNGAHHSLARYYPEGTLVSSGLSKWCGAGGWRLGTFAFPKELAHLQKAITNVGSETFSCVSAPIQYAAVTAFQGGEWRDRYLNHCRRIIASLGAECTRRLQEGGIRVQPPTGGFYIFPSFEDHREKLERKAITDGNSFCEKLIQDTGVALLPGSGFYRPQAELTARLAYVDFDGGKALEGSYRIPLEEKLPLDFLSQYCPKTLEAIDLMVQWIQNPY